MKRLEDARDCQACNGTGRVKGRKCDDCKGTGREIVQPDGSIGNEGPKELQALLRFGR